MATFTASEINALQGLHVGENMVRSHLHAALSVSEVAFLARIPNHAIITEIIFSGGTTGNSTGTWSLGFDKTFVDSNLGASFTVNSIAAAISLTSSAIYRWPVTGGTVQYPIQVSLSDAAPQQFVWLQASPLGSVTATTTSSLRAVVKYRVPGG
jgi:hypothetical protein